MPAASGRNGFDRATLQFGSLNLNSDTDVYRSPRFKAVSQSSGAVEDRQRPSPGQLKALPSQQPIQEAAINAPSIVQGFNISSTNSAPVPTSSEPQKTLYGSQARGGYDYQPVYPPGYGSVQTEYPVYYGSNEGHDSTQHAYYDTYGVPGNARSGTSSVVSADQSSRIGGQQTSETLSSSSPYPPTPSSQTQSVGHQNISQSGQQNQGYPMHAATAYYQHPPYAAYYPSMYGNYYGQYGKPAGYSQPQSYASQGNNYSTHGNGYQDTYSRSDYMRQQQTHQPTTYGQYEPSRTNAVSQNAAYSQHSNVEEQNIGTTQAAAAATGESHWHGRGQQQPSHQGSGYSQHGSGYGQQASGYGHYVQRNFPPHMQ